MTTESCVEENEPEVRALRRRADYEVATARLLLGVLEKRLAKIETKPLEPEELTELERMLEAAKLPLRAAASLLRRDRR